MLAFAAILALSLIGDMPVHVIHIPVDAIVDQVNCADYEPWLDRNGNRVWRLNHGGIIETDSGHRRLPIGDVTLAESHDLWWHVEWTCGPEVGAGIWDQS